MTKSLSAYFDFFQQEMVSVVIPEHPQNLYDPLRYFLTLGGKRIRPLLTLMSAELFGNDRSNVIHQAKAIEMFHNFTLIHDDIMDQAPLRRNMQTIHKKWNENTAILSGDVLLILAYQSLMRNLSAKHCRPVFDLFNKTALDVCNGQQMDLDFEKRSDVSIHEYIEMIRLKTSVLLGCALQIGAICSNAEEKDSALIYQFGQELGIAFQIQDDILDLYGNPDKTGKETGGDVVANKKTILHLSAQTRASKSQLQVMKQLGTESDSKRKIDLTIELYDHLNIKAHCEEMVQQYHFSAMEALNGINVSDAAKSTLVSLAESLMLREY